MPFDENDGITEVIRQTISEMESRKVGGTKPAEAPPAEQPLTVTVNGNQVTFKNREDLEQQLNAAADNIRQMQARMAEAPQPGAYVKDDSTHEQANGFSQEQYIKLMNENPVSAQNYLLNHGLFEGKVDNAMEVMREAIFSSVQANRRLAVIDFQQAHPDVPLAHPQVGNVITSVREKLGLPFSAEGLDAAYTYAVSKGFLPPPQQPGQQYQQQGQPAPQQAQAQPQYQPQQPQYNQQPSTLYGATNGGQQNPYLAPPPAPGRASQFSQPITEDDLENMSADQLRGILDKYQASQRG